MKKIHISILLLVCFATFSMVNANSEFEPSTEKDVIKILIVPGHDREFPGAVYGSRKEADMTLPLALKIQKEFESNPQYSVLVARTDEGYIGELVQYFENTDEIDTFRETHTQKTEDAVEQGEVSVTEGVEHNNAPSAVVTRLYGINKWAGEQDFDMVIHVHFNDLFPREPSTRGEATGFAVYVPGPSLKNASESLRLGNAVGERLQKSFLITNHSLERQFVKENGVIEDDKLIALGAHQTLALPSILVEYGYLYEKAFDEDFFSLTIDVMAHATAEAIQEYETQSKSFHKNVVYTWNDTLRKNSIGTRNDNVLALQYALYELGVYPLHTEKASSQFDGVFGVLTENAVKKFQTEYELISDGIVGPKSIQKLNTLF